MSRSSIRVLVLRHGESTWNAEGRWQGQADPPLTPLGERQAAQAAARLDRVTTIVASDLRRAAHTAEIIAVEFGHGFVQFDARWRERHAGAWQGLTRTEVEDGWPGFLEHGHRPEGFERSRSAGERAMAALQDVAATAAADGAETALVVSHGGILRAVRKLLGIVDDLGFPNLGGQWFVVEDGRIEPGELVSPLDAERPAPTSPL